MALTENQKLLIEAVQKSDIALAKKTALACVKEDESKKNEFWCRKIEGLLTNTPTLLELPCNLKTYCTYEDVSETFLENRYFLSVREKELFKHILTMSKANEELTRLKINYLNSVLLYGPSGTGKTMFGRYVAYKMNLPFLYINFSHLVDSLMGKTAQNLNLVFNFVRQNKCVFMLDEIDTISTRREKAGGGAEAEISRTTVTLMQELDKLSNEHIIIAATNRMDMIDEALLRRLTKKHEVKILTPEEKMQMVKQYLGDLDIPYNESTMKDYCYTNRLKPQSQIINEVNEKIVDYIITKKPF